MPWTDTETLRCLSLSEAKRLSLFSLAESSGVATIHSF